MASSVQIHNLEVKGGKVCSLSISGDAVDLISMAMGEVNAAKVNVKHMQRPLERKFTSIIAKLEALQQDLLSHAEYVADLEARKNTRHTNTLCRQWVNMNQGKQLAGILGALQENWSQDPNIMEGK